MKILITGAAGFIGSHSMRQAALQGHEIVGLDNINDYYDVNLKMHRLKNLGLKVKNSKSHIYNNLRFENIDITDDDRIAELFKNEKFDLVIHLAAQAGVRFSISNPKQYIESNGQGFLNILEGCRHHKIKHLIYASSSSVYGLNQKIPFSVEDSVDHPISLYAATKRFNELMAHTYSHLYGVPTTGLRFFTVYGPWGRPDMAPYIFMHALVQGKDINVFNNGFSSRDFTYIDDVVAGIFKLIDCLPKAGELCNKPNRSAAPFRLFNIGNSDPINLLHFIGLLEKETGLKARKVMQSSQPGEMDKTWSDGSDLFQMTGFRPNTCLTEGVQKFVQWYLSYHAIELQYNGAKINHAKHNRSNPRTL